MIQILGISCAILVGWHLIFEALHLFALLTFKGKFRLIDKFIGFFDEDYTRDCNEYIEAFTENGRQI